MTAMMVLGLAMTSGCSADSTDEQASLRETYHEAANDQDQVLDESSRENDPVLSGNGGPRSSIREGADGEDRRLTIFEDGVEREISEEELEALHGGLLRDSEVWQSQLDAEEEDLAGDDR